MMGDRFFALIENLRIVHSFFQKSKRTNLTVLLTFKWPEFREAYN